MARDFVSGSSHRLERAAPLTAAPITMACWFNVDNTANRQRLMQLAYKANGAANTNFFGLEIGGAGPFTQVNANTAENSATVAFALSSTTISAGVWHHGAAVFAAANSRAAYLDGGGKGTDSTSKTPANIDELYAGAIWWASSPAFFYMDGVLAEAGIWNVALTDAEVASLGAGASPLMIRPANLVAYWPLVRNDLDSVGGFDLTPINGPTFVAHPPIIYPASVQSLRGAVPSAGGIVVLRRRRGA